MDQLEIEVYVRCDSDPYGLDKLFSHLRIGDECVHREQYYTVGLEPPEWKTAANR